jgi:hypothetical protein
MNPNVAHPVENGGHTPTSLPIDVESKEAIERLFDRLCIRASGHLHQVLFTRTFLACEAENAQPHQMVVIQTS